MSVFAIAGFTVSFQWDRIASSSRVLFEGYEAFNAHSANADFEITLHQRQGEPFVPVAAGKPCVIVSQCHGDILEFQSHFERGWVDLAVGRGLLIMRPAGKPENFLRVICAWHCLHRGALLLHAAGVIREGRGYVFFGASGSGKTTIATLSLDHTVLSDDLVILKCDGAQVRVFGVPFRGEMLQARRVNASADVAGIFALEQGKCHQLSPLSPAEAVARLAACVPFVMRDPSSAARAMRTCREIVARMPVQLLSFSRDPGFWEDIDELE